MIKNILQMLELAKKNPKSIGSLSKIALGKNKFPSNIKEIKEHLKLR